MTKYFLTLNNMWILRLKALSGYISRGKLILEKSPLNHCIVKLNIKYKDKHENQREKTDLQKYNNQINSRYVISRNESVNTGVIASEWMENNGKLAFSYSLLLFKWKSTLSTFWGNDAEMYYLEILSKWITKDYHSLLLKINSVEKLIQKWKKGGGS